MWCFRILLSSLCSKVLNSVRKVAIHTLRTSANARRNVLINRGTLRRATLKRNSALRGRAVLCRHVLNGIRTPRCGKVFRHTIGTTTITRRNINRIHVRAVLRQHVVRRLDMRQATLKRRLNTRPTVRRYRINLMVTNNKTRQRRRQEHLVTMSNRVTCVTLRCVPLGIVRVTNLNLNSNTSGPLPTRRVRANTMTNLTIDSAAGRRIDGATIVHHLGRQSVRRLKRLTLTMRRNRINATPCVYLRRIAMVRTNRRIAVHRSRVLVLKAVRRKGRVRREDGTPLVFNVVTTRQQRGRWPFVLAKRVPYLTKTRVIRRKLVVLFNSGTRLTCANVSRVKRRGIGRSMPNTRKRKTRETRTNALP